MFATLSALAILLGTAQGDLEALISRLGAPLYRDREAAAEELERLGGEALGALRDAQDSQDPEIRRRALVLATRIEQTILTEPTRVLLDFRDRPLEEVARVIGERAGVPIQLVPPGQDLWRSRTVTLAEPEPLGFWQALDRLCEAGQLQLPQSGSGRIGPAGRAEPLRLVAGSRPYELPTSDSGPFRTTLQEITLHRSLNFLLPRTGLIGQPGQAPTSGGPPIQEQFYVIFQVIGEPRLMLSQRGPLEILEAVDDQGQSLLPPNTGGGRGEVVIRESGYIGMVGMGQSGLRLQAMLQRPERPGRTIARLRGRVPVLVSSTKPDPLAIRLDSAEGKSFDAEDVRITIEAIQPDPDRQQNTIEMTLRQIGEGPDLQAQAGPFANASGSSAFWAQQVLQSRIEVLDAQGRPLHTIPASTSFQDNATRVTLAVVPQGGPPGSPAELRLHGMARAESEVSFEFRNLPMP